MLSLKYVHLKCVRLKCVRLKNVAVPRSSSLFILCWSPRGATWLKVSIGKNFCIARRVKVSFKFSNSYFNS